MSKKQIIAPISYRGSKRKEMSQINEFEPKRFNKVIDVFGGGSSVSIWYKQNTKKQVFYNDINKRNCELFTILKDKKKTEELIKEYNEKKKDFTEERFYNIYDKKEDMSESCRFLLITSTAFRGDITRRLCKVYNGKPMKPKKIDNFIIYNDIYKDITITNEDYKVIMNRYKNDEEAFVYLDPPFISKTTDTYGFTFTRDDLDWIKDYMDNCKCKVMLNIDLFGHTLLTFGEYLKYSYHHRYSMSDKKKNDGVYKVYHSFFTNYPVNIKDKKKIKLSFYV